jgi:hypothetical protein
MTLDLRSITIENPWDPSEEPTSLAWTLSRILALDPTEGFSNPAEALSASMTLLNVGVVDLGDELALHVERLIRRTPRLNNLTKSALLEEWYRQRLEQTNGTRD